MSPVRTNKGNEGVAQSKAEAINAGETIRGEEVTFELPSGKRTRSDILTENENGFKVRESKKGPTARETAGQKEMKLTAEKGGTVIPRGGNAEKAGLQPGVPVKITQYELDRH